MLRNIPSSDLKKLVKLSERREALIAQIQEIDRQMVRVQSRFGIPSQNGNQGAAVTLSRQGRRFTGRRTKRGALKEKILKVLREAGRKGATIRELSAKVRVPSANLYVWFNGTGKNVRGIQKIGVAKYRLG
jgi:predicted transcriptional regulator